MEYAWMPPASPETYGLQMGAACLLPAFRGIPRAVQAQLELTYHLSVHLMYLYVHISLYLE